MKRQRSSDVPALVLRLSAWLYRTLLSLGPESFRRDYAEQASQDWHQSCLTAYGLQGWFGVLRLWPAMIVETAGSLLAEYWTETFRGRNPMLPTMRRTLITAFWACLLFLLAYLAFARIADPATPFQTIGRQHSEVALSYTIVSGSGVLVCLALLLGGLPLLFVALRQALGQGPRALPGLFLVPPRLALKLLLVALLVTVSFLAFLLGTQYLFGPPSCTASNGCILGQAPLWLALDFLGLIGGLTLMLFVLLLFMAALSLAIWRSSFGRGLLRYTLWPLGLLGLVMLAATLAAALWTLRLWLVDPQFAASSAGLGDGQTAWVVGCIVAMGAAGLLTLSAFIRGLRALRPQASPISM